MNFLFSINAEFSIINTHTDIAMMSAAQNEFMPRDTMMDNRSPELDAIDFPVGFLIKSRNDFVDVQRGISMETKTEPNRIAFLGACGVG